MYFVNMEKTDLVSDDNVDNNVIAFIYTLQAFSENTLKTYVGNFSRCKSNTVSQSPFHWYQTQF